MTPPIWDYPRYSLQLINGFRVNHEKAIARMRENDLLSCHKKDMSLRVLDLANGQLRPQYEILRAQGCRVYGIDRANHPNHSWRDYAYQIARWLYARNIGTNGKKADDTLVCGDVLSLPFQNNSFDVVTSVAAFEHFLDIPGVVKELYRVMRPRGLAWVLVHLFTSPSGGHNVSLAQVPLRSLPRGVDPWDHLRQRRLRFHVPLNEWRRDQYLSEFAKSFEILKHYCAMPEGEHLLTPQIEDELSKFDRDELTCGSYVIVARKPS